MKLCIPIRYKPQGGLYTFVRTLVAYLDQHAVPYTQSLDDEYDALLVNSWVVPYATVARLKRQRPGLTVTQRVDGAARDYGRPGDVDREQARVNMLADATIFQSRYSRHATREKHRVIAQDGPIVYNPVDLAHFSPHGATMELPESAERPRLVTVSFSTNRRKGTWRLDELAARHPQLQFVLCGRFEGLHDRPNVTRLGHLAPAEVARLLRSVDLFLDLTENEACPNVVLEAMASGLPVIHNGSGAVPELVGDAGLSLADGDFETVVRRALAARAELAARARQRADTLFDPSVIVPRYLEIIGEARRRTHPRLLTTLALARRGYPVLPRPVASARAWARSLARRSPAVVDGQVRVGWVTYDSRGGRKRRFADLDTFTGMRTGNVARWLNAHDPSTRHELYDPRRRYDLVVFQKTMDDWCQSEASRIRDYGGRVVFDANVNYYEVWGDYFVPGTEPTERHRSQALAMTRLADWVVADSRYLEQVIRRITPRVTWIPDNVDTTVYAGERRHRPASPVRLVWSGIGKKAAHLLLIRDALHAVRDDAELVLVVDERPPCLPDIEQAIRCRIVPFSDRRYARTLTECDIIISPKRLVNGYEMGHTEYKITLGMAVGLPAVASPQPSYVEAIAHAGGGIIADSPDEWMQALTRLIGDHEARRAMGMAARRTVLACYATPIVARQYGRLLHDVLVGSPAEVLVR